MLTLALQYLNALLHLGCGATAWRAADDLPRGSGERRGWRLAGGGLALTGANLLVQNVFGSLAMLAGRGSGLRSAYMACAPSFDHSRVLALTAVFPLLVWLMGRHRAGTPSPTRVAGALVGLAFGLGVLLGAAQGTRVPAVHFANVSVLLAVELVALLGSLFLLLVRNLADRLLWTALSLYALLIALTSLWMAVLSRTDVPGAWTPPVWAMQANGAVLLLAMLGLARRRLRFARAGIPVPTMYGTP